MVLLVEVVSGVLLALGLSENLWSDGPAQLSWTITALAVFCVVSVARHQRPLAPIVVFIGIAGATIPVTFADGSSWASATWWPLIIGVVALGRASHAFLLSATMVFLARDATSVVVLGSQGASGSVQYLMGFVGVVAAPLWYRVATAQGATLWASLARAGGVLVTATAVWAVLASGSRAALLGFTLSCVFTGVAVWVRRRKVQSSWFRYVAAALVITTLVPTIDVGLGLALGTDGSVVVRTLTQRFDTSVDQVSGVGSPVGGVRVPLWRQAAVAMMERPLGHGPASYGHVIHAYQEEPMLWSGSPHSIWALVAVETGVLGLLSLIVLVVGGLVVAMRRSVAAAAALVAATVVMSLDVFASMPVVSLVWWGVVGTAWGPSGEVRGRLSPVVTAIAVVLVAVGVGASWRLASPCGEGCDPIVHYAGHPLRVGVPNAAIGDDPDDPRWLVWRERYPMAFWLAQAHTAARSVHEPTAVMDLLRAYPFQSAQTFVDAAMVADDPRIAADIAACGLARFFDGRAIRNDWRAQGPVLDLQRRALEALAVGVDANESACVRAAIPNVPIGLQRP